MPSYIVETYLADGPAHERVAREGRAAAAAADLSRSGTTVRYEFSIHVLQDETCFFVFHAPSAQQAEQAAHRARLDPIRVVEAVTSERTET